VDTYGQRFSAAVAAELRAERAAQNLTIQDLVERSGLVKVTLLRYLNAQRDIPVPALFAIANGLGVSPGVLLDRAAERARAEER